MKKNIKSKIVALMLLVLGIFSFAMNISATDDSGKIILSKETTKVADNFDANNPERGRLANVTLTINANSYNEQTTTMGKVDIILVLDGSNSMKYDAEGNQNNIPVEDRRLTALKTSATSFVSDLLDEKGNVRIGIVEYGRGIKQSQALTTSESDLLAVINGLTADGGTNIHAGIQEADRLLDAGRNDAKKVVIILTDGIPTYYNYTYTWTNHWGVTHSQVYICGDGGADKAGDGPYDENWQYCPNDLIPSSEAKKGLDTLKENHKDTDVYTITFGKESEAASKLAGINPVSEEGKTPVYKNLTALTPDDLEEEFGELTDVAKNVIGKNSTVIDTIPKEFKLTDDAKKSLAAQGATYVENSDGTTTITWDVGTIEAGVEKKLSYDVVAKDEYYGSIYTNQTKGYESAVLTTTVDKENPYYKDEENKTLTLKFEAPVADIPAIAYDDHYNNNSSYIGAAESTITGTTIFVNDTNKNVYLDKENADQNVNITDEVIIVEDANTIKIADDTYQIKDGDKVLGVLTMNDDGSFTFISEENVEGDVSFNYYIKSTVVRDGEISYLYSNSAKVTLNVTPREKISISGKKVWDDNNNQDGIRPSSITVVLKANGEEVAETTVTGSEWTFEFNDLYKYEVNHEGNSSYAINYTVEEKTVATGYKAEVSGTTITNTHTPETIDVNGKKVWNDNNNQDGVRPTSVTIELYANGKKVATTTATEENGWLYKFEDVAKYESGKEITYTVKEVAVEGYTAEVSGTTITNTHTPETIDINGKKVWNDNNNQDGVRPTSVTIELYANGKKVATTTATEENGWLYKFEDVAKYESGKEITYTVKEVAVEGYTTEVSGTTITNTHTPETIDVNGKKVWNDNNNQDGIRPSSITVKLLANGSLVGTTKVTEEDNWSFEFKDVPKYKNGKEITYTVVEETVEGYTTEVSGTTITNTHNPEKIKVSGTKTWDDNNNQDGIRPTAITVNLLANGKVVKTITVTEESGWTYEFTNLDKYESGKEIVYTITEDTVSGYETKVNGYDITNTHTPAVITVSGTKTWDDNNNQDGIRPTEITVRLFANGKEVKVKTVTSSNWSYEFTNLPKYENGKEITYTIKEDSVSGYETKVNGYNITNTHTPEVIEVSGSKTWEDNNNQDGIRPTSIIVKLLANGKEVASKTVSSSWTYEFTNLPKYENGKEIKYTISEVSVSGYETKVNGYNITNTHTPEVIEVNGKKVWSDNNNQDGIRPNEITIRLYADGKEVASTKVTSKNNWAYEFTNLDKYANGKEIKYTVKEDKVDGYTTNVDGYEVTNTHTPEVITIKGSKTWEDNNNQDGKRPLSITVKLLANGEEVASTEVTSTTSWTYEFKDVPKYKAGELITYTISEVKVADYTTKVDGYNITNTHTPETTKVSGTKTWDDNNDQDGVRPESITVNLLANGKVVKTITVTEDAGWKYEFVDLPRYENGKEIEYTISEDKVDNYTSKVNGYNITNTHTPEKVTVSGAKTWDDNNNQDGIRPTSITVNLKADGKVVKTITVTEESGWKYTFTDLDKYRDGGVEIEYNVSEEAVSGYEVKVNGYNIINTHTPGTTNVTGTKTWNDNNDQDGIRPNEITINLYADGELVSSKKVTEADGWSYTFANLPEYKAGQKIVYTIEEVAVDGYETKVNGHNVTNTHTPEKITVSGVKTWDDNNDQDGMRPESITVRLLADGKEIASKVVTADTEWKYTFTNVDKYANGNEITYTVTEDAVTGYEGTVNGMDITNKHTPITITINGEKVWVDENDIEGLRPESITIRLLANGEKVDSVKVTEADEWKYSFVNLPQYSEGKEINYTVVEDTVEHYEMSIDKDNKFIIVNTHDPKDITISGTKTWVDSENRYGRPDSIKVTLTGKVGDKVVVEETKEVTEADGWKYTFSNLPEYREGILIVYTIDEADVKDYDKAVNGYDITNTYNPETVDITGTKTWDDNDNQDGLRPESIIINLLANGEKVATTEATEASNWTFEFKDQVVYANGEKITYTVEEVSVDGYTTKIEGFDVTNHHTPETVSYTVSKVWNDQNNNDRIRPENITVRLLADGKEIAVQVIDEASNWTYSFTDLAKYRDGGIAINYEIVEDEVKGYTTTIEKSVSEVNTNTTNVVITNTHENEKNEIAINKTWVDGNNESGKRPSSITVTITGKVNDEVIVTEEVEITEDMDWTYVTNNHDKYLDGEEITYEIEEKAVEGYETYYDGYNITNIVIEVEEIHPPHTDCDDDLVNNESVTVINVMEIPTATKPFDIFALILVVLSTFGLSYSFKRLIESK